MITKARLSSLDVLRYLMLAVMASFALALFRNTTIASFFESVKLPALMVEIVFILYLYPAIKVTISTATIWLFFLVVAFSTTLNSINSSGLIGSVAVFLAIAIYFQAISNIDNPEQIINFVLLKFSLAVAITSLAYLPFPSSFIGGRFAAGYINTNVASAFLSIAVVTLFYSIIFENVRPIHLLLLISSVLLLLLTKGRGSLIATFIPIAIMLLSNWETRSTKVNITRSVAIVGMAWLVFNMNFSGTTSAIGLGILDYRTFELGARELIIQNHIASFWHSPFFGAGAVVDQTVEYGRASGESSYTDLLALSGGIGVSCIGLLIIRGLWVTWFANTTRLGFYVLLCCIFLASSEGYFVSIASAVSLTLWALLASSPIRHQRI
jgi:hypothetical protein